MGNSFQIYCLAAFVRYFANQTGMCFHMNGKEQVSKRQWHCKLLLWEHLQVPDPIPVLSYNTSKTIDHRFSITGTKKQSYLHCHKKENKYLSLRFFTSHQTEQPIVAACSKRSLYKKAGSASILWNRILYHKQSEISSLYYCQRNIDCTFNKGSFIKDVLRIWTRFVQYFLAISKFCSIGCS